MDEEKSLKEVPIFRDLTQEELSQILKIAREVHIPPGKVILQEGEGGDNMYIIEKGLVEISKSLMMKLGREEYRDRDKVLTKLSDEDHAIFGEVALFEEGKRTATAVALTGCQLLEISKPDFLRLAEENPGIGYKITRNITALLCSRLRKMDEDIIKLTTALSVALSR